MTPADHPEGRALGPPSLLEGIALGAKLTMQGLLLQLEGRSSQPPPIILDCPL